MIKKLLTLIKEKLITFFIALLVLATLVICLLLLWNEKIDGSDFAIIFTAVSSALSGIGFALNKFYKT